jgi:hypothetical protein
MKQAGETFDRFRQEAAVTSRRYDSGSKQTLRHGAENRRSAHAKAGC